MGRSGNRWKAIRANLALAFSTGRNEPFEPTPRQEAIVANLSRWVRRRRLETPALMFLESVSPLNYLGSQILAFFHPFVTAFLKPSDYEAFQQMLEDRRSISYLIEQIENRRVDPPEDIPARPGTIPESRRVSNESEPG